MMNLQSLHDQQLEMRLSPFKKNRFLFPEIAFFLSAVALHVLLVPALWSAPEKHQPRAIKQGVEIKINVLPDTQELTALPASSSESKTKQAVETSASSIPASDVSSLDKSVLGTAIENKYYFKSMEVTQRAQVVIDLPKNFSLDDEKDVSHPLQLVLRIGDTGDVDNVLLPENDLNEKTRLYIIESFKLLKFRPAHIGSIPVASEMHIEILGGTLP